MHYIKTHQNKENQKKKIKLMGIQERKEIFQKLGKWNDFRKNKAEVVDKYIQIKRK